MTLQEYTSKIKELEKIKEKALAYNWKEVCKAKEKYIKENCPLSVGDRVQLDGTVGIIEHIDVNDLGFFYGTWRKIKKNGEPYRYENSFDRHEFEAFEKVN